RRGREPDHVGDAARDERGRAAPQGARPHAVFSDLELHAGAGEAPAEAAPRAGRAAGASVARPRAAPWYPRARHRPERGSGATRRPAPRPRAVARRRLRLSAAGRKSRTTGSSQRVDLWITRWKIAGRNRSLTCDFKCCKRATGSNPFYIQLVVRAFSR